MFGYLQYQKATQSQIEGSLLRTAVLERNRQENTEYQQKEVQLPLTSKIFFTCSFFCKAELNVIVNWHYGFMNLSVHDFQRYHTGSDVCSKGIDLRAVSSRCFREQGEHPTVGRNSTVCHITGFYFTYYNLTDCLRPNV